MSSIFLHSLNTYFLLGFMKNPDIRFMRYFVKQIIYLIPRAERVTSLMRVSYGHSIQIAERLDTVRAAMFDPTRIGVRHHGQQGRELCPGRLAFIQILPMSPRKVPLPIKKKPSSSSQSIQITTDNGNRRGLHAIARRGRNQAPRRPTPLHA